MAVPKKKTSHQKQHSRRANWKLKVNKLGQCPNCSQPIKSHQACNYCGYYRGMPAQLADRLT